MTREIATDLLAGLASAFIVYFIHRSTKKGAAPLPPGPKGYPIIGNLLDFPRERMWMKFHEWSKHYGSDIIHLNLLGQDIIVLDSWDAVTDLMERRSSIYSDRPRMPMVMELMGFDFNFIIVRYGDQWRAQRQLVHHVLHPKAAQNFKPHVLRSARNVLRRFLERPNDVVANLRHMSGETIISVSYGLEVKSDHDPYIDASEEAIQMLSVETEPGANMVDFLPILKYIPSWVPGANFHSRAKEGRRIAHNILEGPYRVAKERIDKGDYIPSFLSYCFAQLEEKPTTDRAWQEYLIKGTAAAMYLAGSDTTSSTIICCVINLLRYPDILKRAQAEVDSVVQFGELPTFADEEKLPFITALCMETMRWKELLPLALPHSSTEDDVYKGYRIPKGSIIMGNTWAMLHDETVYPDPFSFKPDRFMKDGKIDKDVRDPSHAVFGFGRRICAGRFMALPAVWITVVSLIAAFDFTKSFDENGNVDDFDSADEVFSGLLRCPRPFKCTVKPRSPKHEETIHTLTE